jgi:putative ABC transport system permease protein
VPLMHLRGDQASQAVKEAGTRTTAGGTRAWVRGSLIVAEVALAVMLVAGAGLLIRSFINLMRVDVGFDSAQLRTFSVVLPAASYDAQRRVGFFAELESRLRALPGVQGVAAMSGLPPLRRVNANDTEFAHIPNDAPQGQFPPQNVDFWQYVTAGYPEMMSIPVVAGRTFTAADRTGAPVVMVNEALAKKFFADRDPIGARLKPGFGDKVPWFTIVGVLKDVKQAGVAEAAGTELYMLVDQMPGARNLAPAQMNFVVRSNVPLATLAPQFRSAVRQLDASLPIVGLRTMDDVVAASVAQPRFLMVLLAVFAGLALLLAAVGTYGVLAYYVSERRQEIGIRMALGADRARILRLVLVRGLALSGIGLIVGLGGAAALGRVMASLLFGVAPTDPGTLAAVAVVIAVAAAAACAIPAWRATRVDPLVVLRDN